MDPINTLFKLINTLNGKNVFIEKNYLELTCNNLTIKRKNCVKKTISKTFFFLEIPLQTGEILIIKEEPNTFFQAYSILLGDQTKLIKAIDNHSKKVYFFEKKYFALLEKKYTFSDARTIPPQVLNNKEFIPIDKELEIIKEIKYYSHEELNLNLNCIHIIKHDKLEVFAPTLNEKHNILAHNLKIPLKNCVENNYFINTLIHIEDKKMQEELLKPILIQEEKIQTLFYQKKEIKKNLVTTLHVHLDKKELIKKIQFIENTNIDLKKLLELIKNKDSIEIGIKNGTYLIPLFKAEKYKTFETKNSFEKEVGIVYKNELNYVRSLKVSKNFTKDYLLKEYFLSPKYEQLLFESENKFCRNTHEALLYLILNDTNPSLFIEEKVNVNKVQELSKHIFSLSKYLIHKSVEYNFLPKKKRAQNAIEHYLLSKATQLQLLSQKYDQNFSKKTLLKETIRTVQEISEIKKTILFEKESLYFLHQCLLVYITILKQFNEAKGNLILSTLEEYFHKQKINTFQSKVNKKNDVIIRDISLTNKIIKKKECLLQMKSDLYKNYFSQHLKFLPNPSSFEKIYFRANTYKLKQISPYNYKHIAKTINGTLLPHSLLIQKRKIKCTKEYYFETKYHNSYKEVLSNEVFSLYVKNQ